MKSHSTTVLSLDQGSQSTRAILYSENGEKLFAWQKNISVHENGKHVEHNPEEILQSCQEGFAEAQNYATKNKIHIVSAGISVQRSAALLVDDQGNARTPVLSWRDTRSQDILRNLSESTKQEIYQTSGIPASVHFLAAKWKWLLQTHHAQKLYPLALDGFLISKLCNIPGRQISASMAQRSMLYEMQTHRWSKQLCAFFELEHDLLPEICPDKKIWGSRDGIPVHVLIGDQQAACFTSTMLGMDGLLNIGSICSCMIPYSSDAVNSSDAAGYIKNLLYRSNDNMRYAYEATCPTPLPLFQYIQSRFQKSPEHASDLWEEYACKETFEIPVLFAPFGGVSTPEWRTSLPFLIENHSGDNNDTQILIALLENLLFSISWQILDLQKHTRISLKKLLCGGGYSNIRMLIQGIAELTGIELISLHDTELSALGAVALARTKDGEQGFSVLQESRDGACLEQGVLLQTAARKKRDERFQKWKHLRQRAMTGEYHDIAKEFHP